MVKQLIAEVFTRLGARKVPPLQPGWASAPHWQSTQRLPKAAPAAAASGKEAAPHKAAFSALEPPVKLGSMASPDYVASLNRRISRFKERVVALDNFMHEEPQRGTRRPRQNQRQRRQ